ncbi:MAG: ATP-binding protein [Propionibacteriaceae bacterium]
MSGTAAAPPLTAAQAVLGSSRDGRSFQMSSLTGTSLGPGALVLLTSGAGETQLGLIEADDPAPGGRLLGSLDDTRGVDARTTFAFTDAEVTAASSDIIAALHASTRATMEVGTGLLAPGGPARLLPHRFNRHTFWCGQSGSGKTYALGVVLERLIAQTALPVVIFDPNSDFVRLGELNPGASGPDAEALAQRDIRVLRPRSEGAEPLRARFTDLTPRALAAVLQLDPVVHREEYYALQHLGETFNLSNFATMVPTLLASEDLGERALGLRIDNLRLMDSEVWARGTYTATEVIEERPDATVLDLGGFSSADAHLVVAISVLDDLWERRESRRPVLLVIDEAHNLCSPELESPLAVAVRERLIQIAAEGRKFGLWLLLSTQRPSKVHPGIISQCDNLALMRMSSPQDLQGLATYFGFAPQALLARSPWFRQGEALFAGGFVAAPTLLKVGTRLSPEGGSDVGVPLRETAVAT